MTTFSRGWTMPFALGAALALAGGTAFAQQPPQAQPQQQQQQQQPQMPMQAPGWQQMPQAMQPGSGGYPGSMGQGGWMRHGPMHQGMGPGWMQQGGQQGPTMPPGGQMAGPGYGPGYGPGPMMGGQSPMMGGPGMHPGRGPGMMHGRGCPMMDGQGPMHGPGCPMMGGMYGGADDGNQPPFIAGRIAFLRAELGITDAQQPAFDELAGAMRRMYEGAQAARMAMHGNAEPTGSPVERLGARIAAMEGRLLAMKEVKQALDKLYAALTEEQRQRANHAMRFGMGRMW